MATALVESSTNTSTLMESKKRTREQIVYDSEEEQQLECVEEIVAAKKCKTFADTRIAMNIQITKEIRQCLVEMHCIENENVLQTILEYCPLDSFTHGKISDFCFMDNLLAYKNYANDESSFTVPTFELVPKTDDARVMLAYLKGLLQRKGETAVIPIPNSKFQLLLFDKDSFSSTSAIGEDQFFQCNLQCILVEKFKFVLDLDETLVRTRLAHMDATVDNSFEGTTSHPIEVNGQSFLVTIRPGTIPLLRWLSQLFQVYVFTNGIYAYAVEVCKLLDPTNETILKQVDSTNTKEWKSFLKAREDMTNVCNTTGLGIKDLQKHGLNIFETVALDDDAAVWKNKENLLNFEAVTKNSQPQSEQDLFYQVRNETWLKLKLLLKIKAKYKQRFYSVAVSTTKGHTFSQEIAQSLQ